MLETTKTVQFRGTSKIGTDVAKVFEATVNTATPDSMNMNSYILNYDLYKANRTTIADEQMQFEDMVYAYQESLKSGTAV